MFRAIVKQRTNLDMPQIADMQILSATIKEDLTQKTSSSIDVVSIPSNVSIGDLVGIYNAKGEFIYWGVINSIKDKNIGLNQFNSIFNDNHLIVPQTSTNQKSFFNTKPISYVIDMYLKSKEKGYQSIANTMSSSLVYTFTGLVDKDVADTYKGIKHTIIDTDNTFMPFPLEKKTENLEKLLYDTFSNYNRIVRPQISTKRKEIVGYTKLDYIESSGTQYINTGYAPNQDTKFEIEFELISNTGTGAFIFGNRTGSSGTNANKGLSRNISNANRVGFGNGEGTTVDVSGYNQIGVRYKIYFDKNKVYFDDVLYKTFKASTWQSAINTYLFAVNTNGTTQYYSKIKLFKCKIWTENQLERDYVPVIRDSDGAIGLLDVEHNEFYGNNGTGEFVAGGEAENPINIAIFNPNGLIEYEEGKYWDYSTRNLFDTYNYISNVNITKQDEDTNVVAIYNNAGTSLRGAYTILNDGTIQQITTDTIIPNRVGCNKTKYVFDETNVVLDLAKANLPNVQYNHKITFNIDFNGEYSFDDFNLGQSIRFYSSSNNELYETMLTSRSYKIVQNSDIISNAQFTLGKVRTELTSKLNKQ